MRSTYVPDHRGRAEGALRLESCDASCQHACMLMSGIHAGKLATLHLSQC